MRVRLVGLVALMALVIASCGSAAPEAGGSGEGIQVHGDWTMDIYNQDGSLDRRVDFSNALTQNGNEMLNLILGGAEFPQCKGDFDCDDPDSTTDWAVHLDDRGNEPPCEDSDGNANRCFVQMSVDADALPEQLILTGSRTAQRDGQIDVVSTMVGLKHHPFYELFTEKVFVDENGADRPESVLAGQTVQVEVAISFTSG